MYVLTELGYVLICQVRGKGKKCNFENALVEKSESSTRNKNGLVEGFLLFSIRLLNMIVSFLTDLIGHLCTPGIEKNLQTPCLPTMGFLRCIKDVSHHITI